MIGKYVIVRGNLSGVFAGTLEAADGQTVTLRDARRLWRWAGATDCCQLAAEGVKLPGECKFTVTVDSIMILDAIEILPTTAMAERLLKDVPVWRA